MYLDAEVDLDQIKFECSNCRHLVKVEEKPRLTVWVEPCKCILEDKEN